MLRRIAIVGIAIAISAVLLHSALSSALVTRGDDLSFSGNVAGALKKYSLAHLLDRTNATASDRYAFAAIRTHNPLLLTRAIGVIDETSRDEDLNLAMDRALCMHLLGRYEEAAVGFERVARMKHDARAMLFAALDEKRRKRTGKARELVALAVSFEPNFAPARDALARSSRW